MTDVDPVPEGLAGAKLRSNEAEVKGFESPPPHHSNELTAESDYYRQDWAGSSIRFRRYMLAVQF
ncbi:MAG TPA: hypothetical protein VE862_11380 [Candidatus Acidoferrum sp.]|nr:hypothetical protein [Candidatus Acidoferrum sp.]